MYRSAAFAMLVVVLLAAATPAVAADPPAVTPPAGGEKIVEKITDGVIPFQLSPTLIWFVASGGGSYTGRITWVPITDDPDIQPHEQVENSRFDFSWTGDLGVALDQSLPPLLVLASTDSTVSGHVMVHLHQALPNDPEAILGIPVGVPVTPYSFTIILDSPVQVLPSLTPTPIYATHLQITDGRLLVLK